MKASQLSQSPLGRWVKIEAVATVKAARRIVAAREDKTPSLFECRDRR